MIVSAVVFRSSVQLQSTKAQTSCKTEEYQRPERRRINKIDNPAKAAKPPSPVQIREHTIETLAHFGYRKLIRFPSGTGTWPQWRAVGEIFG
jgi:hypothetical protein